jgi:hypothetical protein
MNFDDEKFVFPILFERQIVCQGCFTIQIISFFLTIGKKGKHQICSVKEIQAST